MFLTILIASAIFFVLFLIQRYQKRMAALIAWIIGTIVSKKSVEEKPPDLSRHNQRNRKKIQEASSKSNRETFDIKSKKQQSEKKASYVLKTNDSDSNNSNSNNLLKNTGTTEDFEEIVAGTNSVHSKQGKSKKKNLSKSADKLQNIVDFKELNLNQYSKSLEKDSLILNIHKSSSLPNFQKSNKVNNTTKITKKVGKEQSTIKVNHTKLLVENSQKLFEGECDNDDLFITVSHKKQPNKKSISDNNFTKLDSNKQTSDKRPISDLVSKTQFSDNSKKKLTFETNKTQLVNLKTEFDKKILNIQSATKNLSNTVKVETQQNLVKQNSDKADNKSLNTTSIDNTDKSKNAETNSNKLNDKNNKDKLSSNTQHPNQQTNLEITPLPRKSESKKPVFYSKEAITSSELGKPKKLRKIQSDTKIIFNKQPESTEQLSLTLNKDVSTPNELKLVTKEVEITQLKKEINRQSEIETTIVVEKKDLLLLNESKQQKQLDLKSSHSFVPEVSTHSSAIETEQELSDIQTPKLELKQIEEDTIKVSVNQIEKKLTTQSLESALKTKETEIKLEDSIKQTKTRSSATKTVDNLPPSTIIEHYKLKYKSPQIPGILLNSGVANTQVESLNVPDTKLSQEKKDILISNKGLDNFNTTKMVTEVRVLTLNDNEHQESTLYRLEKNWILQFRLGSSLLGRKVALYCNYPLQKEFNRNKYYLIPWCLDVGCTNADDTALFAEITIKLSGSFHYYFVYENATESGPQGSGYFLVDPVLQYGNKENLPLNCIQCQTVLSKCLGPFSTWEDKLRVSKESGYNLIHFTPIQELGKSNSAYSLSAQLKLNPTFNENGKLTSFHDIEKLMLKIRSEWKVISICDIVLNHTANETSWLQEHPEGTYNCFTCPYMRPAYLLDAAFATFSEDVKNNLYESMGIPSEVNSEDHLNSIRYWLHTKVLKEINLPELFTCDVNKLVSEFQDLSRKNPPQKSKDVDEKLKLVQDPAYRRLASKVDMNLALKLYNVYRQDSFDEDARIKHCSEDFKNELDTLNRNITNVINDHLNAAVENVIAGIRYFRVQGDGPKIKEITIKDPLCSRYFTDYGKPKNITEYEEAMYSENSKYLMAHNGWVMNADPMRNFADPDSFVYIRRELIAWGDSVKLRYGDKPEDCPFLWNHMKEYVELTAKIFDGVRLDNCHSTPLPVAEYLLDCARKVRPDLYVVAELFTNSDHTDNVFVNRLGITSLIREAMSAWDSHEEGRLVYRYGGDPVGAFFQLHTRPLVPSIAHALFLDLSHDNPSPVEKRSVFDLLPSSALVNMACCASGSNRGYDELVNHHIHVVDEHRQYTEWTNDIKLTSENARYVSRNSGIIVAKKSINDLHFQLGAEGFNQVYVDQIDPDIVAVTRHQPQTHESVILVAFTAFTYTNQNAGNYQRGIKPLRVEGVLDEIILEATLSHVSIRKGGSKYAQAENFIPHQQWINGLSEYEVIVKQHIQLAESDIFELADSGSSNITQLNFKNFKPGSVVAIRVSPQKHVQESIIKLRETMASLSNKNNAALSSIINELTLADLNRALYRCDQEEKDEGYGFSTYNIPNFGSLVYCGLQGFISLLSGIRSINDLGHPMCGNLRDGNWMIDYICQRLKVDNGTKALGQWIDKNIEPLKTLPRYLIPSYFDVAVTNLYILLLERSYHLMSDFVKNGSTFVKGLSLGSLQFAAAIKSADLPTLSPNLASPKPPMKLNNHGKLVQTCVTLSAGLPHFSVGYMRNWGRDTFIALRGLFILTGRFEDARYHILGYAACLRHGLIPNLLDAGRNSRFNCRDAVWWWLYCIKSYVEEAPNGINILSDKVSRIFPTDESPPQEPGVSDQPLYEVIQESIKTHFQGLAFRERNAGRQIDAHMADQGFNNQIGIHPETGFVFGGNEFNCGTWMDKMGSSDKAGNRSKPATPRDGSAVELIGLSKAVVTWLSHLYKAKQYPYEGVERINKNGSVTKWTFNEWSEKIQKSFEQYFWINTFPTPGEARPDLINKRGIYKDSYGATQDWADFQLRCNFPIAMVAAPELFDSKHAWVALQKAEKYLLGPLGMKTLDPDDWAYCGDYNNSDDSNNFKTACGFNYHQGPEWVWPVGFYLRAKLHFAAENGDLTRTIANVKVILSKHFTELQTSHWRGLPELTNSNGSYCNDSSRTQAWSMACILEVLYDLQRIESTQQLKSN